MSRRRRRSGIKSLVGSWRGEQIARESLQDRLAALPYEVLEKFLRERGYEPANRGHAVILMVREFPAEAEEMLARYRSLGSSFEGADTVSDTVDDTAEDTVAAGVAGTVSGLTGQVSPMTADTAGDTAGDTARDTVQDATDDTPEDTVLDTAVDTGPDTGGCGVPRSPDERAEAQQDRANAPADTVEDTATDAVAATVSDTVADTSAGTVAGTSTDTASATADDAVSATVSDTVAMAASDTVADTVADTVSGACGGTSNDTERGAAESTTDTLADTVSDTVSDTVPDTVEGPVAAAAEPTAFATAGGSEPAREQPPSAASEVGGRIAITFPGWENPLELPAASEVRWVPASQWRGPSRGAQEFLKRRASWWVERRSAADAGATQLVGVYLLPEHRATLDRLRAESGLEAYKLIGLALELLLHEAATGQELPELPPRDRRTSRVLYLFGLQTRPRLDQEGKRLFVRLHPPLWHAVEQISTASHRSPSEFCNIAVYVLAETLSRLAP